MALLRLSLVLAACSTVTPMPSGPIMVRTAQGRLSGDWMVTYTGKLFFAFRGVRYAEPPRGDYRFKPPVPVKPWEEVREAVTDAPICPQPFSMEMAPKSSEDCLFLNVYTRELTKTARLPVMVYLHAGGFSGVTGSSQWAGPQYLLDSQVVLVTINYRLGALGFVSTGDSVLPGNYGMKDQVEALKWVQQNIASFGGDPGRVTVFGYSAGGASVMMHMVSPLSRGLFHRAIAMSGSATTACTLNRRPRDLAIRLAHNLGCPTSDSRLIYVCLMRHSAEQIVNATLPIKDFELYPVALFAPVVEPGSGSDRFLPAEPLALISSGQVASVPLLTGVTRDEFAARGFYVLQNKSLTEEFNRKFDTLAPVEFMYEREGERSRNITAAMKRFYLKDQPISNRTKKAFMEMYADSIIMFSVVQTAKLMAKKGRKPVYLYLFNYSGSFSHNYIPGTQTPLGIDHHDDLIYLFHISRLFPQFNATDKDAGMVRMLTSIWTNFADTGEPTTPCTSTVWQPLHPSQDRYLEISRCPRMVQGVPFPDRMAFWESQFPLNGPHQEYY